jgi:hypothetical protein
MNRHFNKEGQEHKTGGVRESARGRVNVVDVYVYEDTLIT